MHVLLVGPEFEENLSLRYLAAALIEAGHAAGLARFDSMEYLPGVLQQAASEKPALIGLSMVFQVRAREFMELARELRRAGYAGHITAGGHFATFACEPLLREVPEIDSIVRQEGEETITALASALDIGLSGEEIAAIPGMVTRGVAGEIVFADKRIQAGNLDALSFPIRDDRPELHLGIPTAFLVGSRGCYADCDYCSIFAWHEAAVGKRYRLRTPANIAEEMSILYHDRGVRFFVFHDDNFFLPSAIANHKRFEALKGEIDRRGLRDIGLMLKLRPNDCDRENMLLLKEVGLLRAFVGIENASQRQLKSLGRDSTIGDVEACLSMLRELDIYATFNILLFDPYTTLEDVDENLRFMRQNSHFPFNWCKVEPYAGTALEKRYAAEGRLRGDYLGHDYMMDDPRTRLMYDLLLPAFYYRNYDYYGLANLNIGLGYHRQLLKHFHPGLGSDDLFARAQTTIETINENAVDLMERTLTFVKEVDLVNRAWITRFGDELKADCFRWQHILSEQAEAVLRDIERAAGVRTFGPVGLSEAFMPLGGPPSAPDPGRRSLVAAAAGAVLWLLAGCRKSPPAIAPPPNPRPESTSTPQARINVAEGYSDTVGDDEAMVLEGILQPGDVKVIGEPRVTCTAGKINHVAASSDRRAVRIEFQPAGGSRAFDPNEKVTVAWTVRGSKSDTLIVTHAFVHLRDDGKYAFGFETPRPTIAEMAAPPISHGPNP